MKFTRLRELRKKNKMNIDDMADLIKLTKRAYVSYENGEREPKLSSLIKMADFFNVSTDYIINRSDYKQPVQSKSQEILDLDITDAEKDLLKQYRLLKPEMQQLIGQLIAQALNQQTAPSPTTPPINADHKVHAE